MKYFIEDIGKDQEKINRIIKAIKITFKQCHPEALKNGKWAISLIYDCLHWAIKTHKLYLNH